MIALTLPRAAWAFGFGLGISIATVTASAQVSTHVTVLPGKPVQFSDNSIDATMPPCGLGLGTSVYANQWGNPALPGLIRESGVQTLRYPGGSYADMYNWSTGTGNGGAYIAAHSDFGNFIRVMDESHTNAILTVNYGSNTTDTIGAQPQEAAAWVAYANSDPAIYGSAGDVNLGKDASGVNWFTAGYWARLRSSAPAEYKSWATQAGTYDPAYLFLAIHHPKAIRVHYWEIGNEVGGDGYYGPQWEYDLHAPYKNGDSKSNAGRKGNPLLSPITYGHNFIRFARLMKSVDPSIKVGTGFAASRGDKGDETLLRVAGDFIDFGIIHWYPAGPNPGDPVASLPGAVISGPFSLSQSVENLRKVARIVAYKNPRNFDIMFTEFNYSAPNASMASYALFAADAYMTGFENGAGNMDLQEMIGKPYLGDGPPAPGSEFYAIQMCRRFGSSGDRFICTDCSDPKLRVHAVRRPDGGMSLLFINDGAAADHSQDRNITVSVAAAPRMPTRATLYLFGAVNTAGSAITPPISRTMKEIANPFTLTVPQQTIGVLVFSDAELFQTIMLGMSTFLVGPRRRLSPYSNARSR